MEPATGVVRVRRPRESPLTVTPDDARWLAEQPCTPERVRDVLAAAADEAERQGEVLLELMESRAEGSAGPRRHGGY